MILAKALQDNQLVSQYFRDIDRYKPLKADDEKRLAKKIRQGNKAALKKLVTANLRFVVSVALSYTNKGMPLEDLINEGNLGLIRAALRFDEKKNFKFISYASWWIRHAILLALSRQSRIFTVPTDQVAKLTTIGKNRRLLEQKLKRGPTLQELALESKLTLREISRLLSIDRQTLSLEGPVDEDRKNIFLKNCIKNTESESPDRKIASESSHIAVMRIIRSLKARDKQIIEDYYGLMHEESLTLQEIGKNLKITRERVRQLRDQALKKLKRADLEGYLREFAG